MGNWFENMEPMNIQEERANTKRERERADQAEEERDRAEEKLNKTCLLYTSDAADEL